MLLSLYATNKSKKLMKREIKIHYFVQKKSGIKYLIRTVIHQDSPNTKIITDL